MKNHRILRGLAGLLCLLWILVLPFSAALSSEPESDSPPLTEEAAQPSQDETSLPENTPLQPEATEADIPPDQATPAPIPETTAPESTTGEEDALAPETTPTPEETTPVEAPDTSDIAEINEPQPRSIAAQMGTPQDAVLQPGEKARIALPVIITIDGQSYASNQSATGPELLAYRPDAPTEVYDQSLTTTLQEVSISLPEAMPEDLPFDISAATLHGVVIGEGQNLGYALLEGLGIHPDAGSGSHTLPLILEYLPQDAEEPQRVEVSIELRVEQALQTPAPRAYEVWEDGGVIVTDHASLREVLKSGLYSLVYLGWSDSNQGTIAFQDAAGLPISRDTVIDGTDPRYQIRMKMVDYSSHGPLDGLYAAKANLSITVRNIDVVGHNYYGIVYGSAYAGVKLHYKNINYQGRQIAHNIGANATVTFTGCTVLITSVGSGDEQEVVEAPAVNFFGSNTIRRTGGAGYSMLYIYGTGTKTITIAPGAEVSLETTGYMVYTDNSAQLDLQVYGSLRLTTAGGTGSATYADMFFGQMVVYPEGVLSIDHQNAARPTLQVYSLSVQGELRLSRTSSTQPLLRVESAGNVQFDNPRLVTLENAGGALIRNNTGSSTLALSTQVVNRYVGGALNGIWNNNNLLPFTVNLRVSPSGAALDTVSGLEQENRGVAIGASAFALSLMSDTGLRLGKMTLALDEVEAGQRNVSGEAQSGMRVEIREYAYAGESGLGALLQSAGATASGGRFSLAETLLPNPIAYAGSRVYAIGGNDVLTAHIYSDPLVSGPVFVEVPETLPFQSAALSGQDQRIPRQQEDWKIVVYDPRQIGDGFALYVQSGGGLASGGGDVLPQSLIYVNGQSVIPLGEGPVLIARGDTADGIETYDITWAADQGLLARLAAFHGQPDTPYSATLTFTLANGPQ